MTSSSSFLIALTAVAQMILMAVTWPLWFSQSEYPMLGIVPLANQLPLWFHQLLSALLMTGCLAIAVLQLRMIQQDKSNDKPTGIALRAAFISRWLVGLLLFSAVSLVLLDQHRLQPWHWLTFLILTEWTLLNQSDFLKTVRITLATVYIFASLSRFGPDVAAGMSGQVLKVILKTIELEWIQPGDQRFKQLAILMNSAELLIGVTLLFHRIRRAAVVGAVLLHLTLLICLSPLGLNHHAGVLVWNAFLMIIVPVAFWHRNSHSFQTPAAETSTGLPSQRVSRTAKFLIAAVLFIPASALFAVADNWLGWQVYSPRPEILKVTVDERAIRFLPGSLKPFVQPPQPLQTDCVLRLDLWSLHCKSVPVYPEDRLQIATAKFVVAYAVTQGASPTDFKAEIRSPSRFCWWKRSRQNVSL